MTIVTRADIVACARAWIGTPYRHQASLKGAGTDCLGLVRGVWRALYGGEPEALPPYTPDWAEASARETLRDAAARHLIPVAIDAIKPGDVVLFRLVARGPAKHAAILSAPHSMIHAYADRAVIEAPLDRAWRRRLSFAFSFPGVID